MGLNFFKWMFGKEKEAKEVTIPFVDIATEIYIRELSFNFVKSKITNAINKCQINVYNENKKVKDNEWYRWNIQPNKNQSASQFWSKLIDKLYDNNEALVIVQNDELYVADSYILNDDLAFYEHYFQSVTVNNFTFAKNFKMSEVFYFKLGEKNLKTYLDGTLKLYDKLINSSYNSYLTANGNKGTLEISQYAENADDFQETFNKMINEDFKKFFSSANAVMPLFEGYKYTQLDNKGTQTTTRDLRAMIDDVITLTANALNVPASIALGNVQDTSKAIDEFLTFCIDPLIRMLSDEMNRKLFTSNQLIKGTHISFDTKAIKHIDLLDVATSIDKLISSGFTCINDLRELCGMDRIDEEWANQFFMTKNYSTIEELMKALKGGEGNEE